ncbi:hypothetical protein ACFFV7_40900 [Nonomuraea spiralis]|uniref:Uncharacterized protein n=1 Tax=Nonomuraea spiralis TaxID=46182 RepID=A0ABV5IV22_9ACTN|nr:hypothetical protein [Nonomuraea spiralis]
MLVGGLLVTGPVWASARPWTDGYGRLGTVEISADRKRVMLCDALDDEDKVAVEYKTTIGRTILLQAGPKSGCVEDSVFFGSIKRAQFCHGPDVDPDGGTWRWCNPARNI